MCTLVCFRIATVSLDPLHLLRHCAHPFLLSLWFNGHAEDLKICTKTSDSLPPRRVDMLELNVHKKAHSPAVFIHVPEIRVIFELAFGLPRFKRRPADVTFHQFMGYLSMADSCSTSDLPLAGSSVRSPLLTQMTKFLKVTPGMSTVFQSSLVTMYR